MTVTAQVGTSSKSATLRVLPPKLSVLGCDIPPNVAPQKPLKCTAWLDGLAPEATTVTLSSSLPVAAIAPATVTIARGSNKEAFQVKAEPIAQSASVQISATYAGVTKSAPVTVMPVALESFTIYPASAWGGNNIDFIVKLTAPPPPVGLKVKLSADFPPWKGRRWLFDLMMTSQEQRFTFGTYGVDSEATFAVTASSEFTAGDVRQASVRIIPAPLSSVAIDPDHFANVPLGGQKANVTVTFNGLPTSPNSSTIWIDLQYGGDTSISGPARIDAGQWFQPSTTFPVTVSPCSVQATCTVFVKARFRGVEKQATATVSH